jgi:hypothetical protein
MDQPDTVAPNRGNHDMLFHWVGILPDGRLPGCMSGT